MAHCVYKPTIINKGQENESKLFNDLLSLTGNRESSKYLWGLSQIKEFTDTLDNLEYDENGEVTVESLNKAINIKDFIDGKTSLLTEKRSIGAIDKNDNPINYQYSEDIIDKVNLFNQENESLVASIDRNGDKFVINVEQKNLENSEIPNQQMFSNNLNNHLRGIMQSLGFDVEVKNSSAYHGVFDPTTGQMTADGLRIVVKVGKGELGEKAFPEEFSHVAIAGLQKEPLVQRTMSLLNSREIIEEVLGEEDFEKYDKQYEGDFPRLQKEAAGKLLQKHIVQEEIPESINKGLVGRLWNFVKNKFSKLEESDIDKAINDANQGFAKVASKIMDKSILPLFDKTAVMNEAPLFKLADDVDKMKLLSDKALEVASKRLKILQVRSKNGRYSEDDIHAIKNLQDLIEKKKYSKSSLAFLEDSLYEINKLSSQIRRLQNIDSRDDSDLSKISSMSSTLRRIKEFADAYSPIIHDMSAMEVLRQNGEVDITEEDAKKIAEKAAQISAQLAYLNKSYEKLRFNTSFTFLKLFWGEDKVKTLDKNKGDSITLEMIMSLADRDINGLDRWISSMSGASDALLSLIDKAVKMQQYKRDQKIEEALFEIRKIHLKLQRAGHNTEFMFEKDEAGKKTGRLISDIDFIKFERDKKEFIDDLKKQKLEWYVIQSKVEAWERKRTEPITIDSETNRMEVLPAKSIYGVDKISKLNPAQREYYDNMIKLKSVLDALIPSRYAKTYNAIQVRNDLVEGLSNVKSPAEAVKMVMNTMQDKLVIRSDNDNFGLGSFDSSKQIVTDFAGKAVEKLPIYYTQPLEDMNRLSTDFTSSLLAYAGMAINYHEMNKVIDVLELTRDLVKERPVQQMSGDKKLLESYKILNKAFHKPYVKYGGETNIGGRIDDYYAQVLYGRKKIDEGSIMLFGKEVSKSQALDLIRSYTGQIGLGLNLFSAISNVTMGRMQLFIESMGGEYFNFKDSQIGKKNYWALLPQYMGELNSIKKSGKLGLLIDKYDALEEFNNNIKHKDFYKGPMARIFGGANMLFMNEMGEHYLHSRNMLAMLNAYKVKDKNGKTISLFDAYQVEEIKEDGQKYGGVLKLKEGITKLDGSEFSNDDFLKLKMKINRVAQSLNGAFNETDKGALQRYALGRLAMQFRQWMPEHYYRRLAKPYYDARLDQYREGYYRTLGKFAWNAMKDIRKAQFHLATNWQRLTPHEVANMKRAIAEMATFLVLSGLIALIGPAKDKEGLWADRMIIYQLKRLNLEVGASIPIHPSALDNMWTMLQSPAAAIKSFDNMGNLLQFWNVFNEVESGRYKGWNEYARDLIKATPWVGQVNKVIDITTEDYMFNIFN